MARVQKVRDFRLKSTRELTRKLADSPTLFSEIRQPDSNYLLVPRATTQRRKYVPIGFLTGEFIASDANSIISNATLFDFGILTSIVHMAWMRAVCGRLRIHYRYSIHVVYNNFIWPKVGDKQKEQIAVLAQEILNARALFPDSSLSDLYDPLKTPPALLKAHKALDTAVLKLYKLKSNAQESEIVSHLMKLYAEKTGQKWD